MIEFLVGLIPTILLGVGIYFLARLVSPQDILWGFVLVVFSAPFLGLGILACWALYQVICLIGEEILAFIGGIL